MKMTYDQILAISSGSSQFIISFHIHNNSMNKYYYTNLRDNEISFF